MKNLVIFGTGPFAEIARYYVERDSDYTVVAFTVDAAYRTGNTFQGLPLIPFEEISGACPPSQCEMFVAMGIQKVNQHRAAKAAAAEAKGYTVASFLSPKAKVAPDLVLRPNTFVMEEAFIQPFVEIGRDTIIWPRTTIGFKSRIGEHCWIVAATLGEAVVVGDYTFIGVNATIAPCFTIGARNVIGAGALILQNTRESEVYKGCASVASRVPSHRLRRI